MPRRNGVEHVADMHAVHRARRTLQRGRVRARERDHRPMHAILDARRDEADHALVPGLVEQAQTERQRRILGAHVRDREHRLLLHLQLELAAILVQLREARREQPRRFGVVRQQALNADRHVVEPAGRVQSRPDLIAEIGCDALRRRRGSPLPAAREPRRSNARRECAAAPDARARGCCDRAARDPRSVPSATRSSRSATGAAAACTGRASASRASAPPSGRTRRRRRRAPCWEMNRPARSDSRCAVAAGSVGGARW